MARNRERSVLQIPFLCDLPPPNSLPIKFQNSTFQLHEPKLRGQLTSSMALNPRESGKLISELSEHVKIKQEGIEKLGNVLIEHVRSGELDEEPFGPFANDPLLQPNRQASYVIDWFFVVDTLNFCFWHGHEGKTNGWGVNGQTGYYALCVAINRAIQEKVDILNPSFYSTISEKQLDSVLRSDTQTKIPLLTERTKCLHEVGTCLIEKYGGSFENCIKEANHSAVKLLQLITENFKCYKDEAYYKGHHVSLHKRAQILIADIYVCLKNEGLGYFHDIDQLTMFADYRVPQSLLYFNAFEYSGELRGVLNASILIPNGNEMEVEIRGCSIQAVELLKQYANSKLEPNQFVNSILVDHFLWKFRRRNDEEIEALEIPFHKTLCIYY